MFAIEVVPYIVLVAVDMSGIAAVLMQRYVDNMITGVMYLCWSTLCRYTLVRKYVKLRDHYGSTIAIYIYVVIIDGAISCTHIAAWFKLAKRVYWRLHYER
jgi:hypothetical protein